MAENCSAVLKELHKAEKKLDEWQAGSVQDIDAVLLKISDLLEKIEGGTDVLTEDALAVQEKARKTVEGCAQSHKKYHSDISRIGKVVDKNFFADFSCTCLPDMFEDDHKKLLDQGIHDHLVRQSRVDISKTLCAEAGLEEASINTAYVSINKVMDSLKDRDVLPAIAFLQEAMEPSTSTDVSHQTLQILFKLMTLRFVRLVDGDLQEALSYYALFDQFLGTSVAGGISQLAGCFVYRHRLANSPYSEYLDDAIWDGVRESFLRVATQLNGMPVNSPLSTCVWAGTKALPAIVDMHVRLHTTFGQVPGKKFEDKDKGNGKEEEDDGAESERKQLQIEVKLGERCFYHSIFSCPILRRGNAGDPIRLRCGHVISNGAYVKIRVGSRARCPYCPDDTENSDASRLYF